MGEASGSCVSAAAVVAGLVAHYDDLGVVLQHFVAEDLGGFDTVDAVG